MCAKCRARTRRASSSPAHHASTALRFVPASRARPEVTGGDSAAPGWRRARLNRKRPPCLSITHIFSTEGVADGDIGKASEAAPHDDVAWGWIPGTRKIAAESSDLDYIVGERVWWV